MFLKEVIKKGFQVCVGRLRVLPRRIREMRMHHHDNILKFIFVPYTASLNGEVATRTKMFALDLIIEFKFNSSA